MGARIETPSRYSSHQQSAVAPHFGAGRGLKLDEIGELEPDYDVIPHLGAD
jgi:hypothetical protein